MKNFRVQIRYYGYYADFTVMAEDTVNSIENSILDKLGKNEVIFESDGFTTKKGKWITYEEVINDSSRYTLNMVKIDDKIREIVTEIKLEEARVAHRVNQIEEAKAEVSIAT